jgi:hypothetical protein
VLVGLFEAALVLCWLSDWSYRYITGCFHLLKPLAYGTELANNIFVVPGPQNRLRTKLKGQRTWKSHENSQFFEDFEITVMDWFFVSDFFKYP